MTLAFGTLYELVPQGKPKRLATLHIKTASKLHEHKLEHLAFGAFSDLRWLAKITKNLPPNGGLTVIFHGIESKKSP